MPDHLEPVERPDDPDEISEAFPPRPAWWRWVAIVVVVAMVVATPFAYALYLLLR